VVADELLGGVLRDTRGLQCLSEVPPQIMEPDAGKTDPSACMAESLPDGVTALFVRAAGFRPGNR
jgi:hypothetical protein